MGADVRIAGEPFWNTEDFSVEEDSTPIDPTDTSGAVGQITVGVTVGKRGKRLRGRVLDLEDGVSGSTQGTIRGSGGDSLNFTPTKVTADSRLALLAVERQLPPMNATVGLVLRAYFALCSITDRIVIDSAIEDTPLVVSGYYGFVWDRVKQMGVAHGFEVSLVSDNVVVRYIRGRTVELKRNSQSEWQINDDNLAQRVDIMRWEKAWATNVLGYPAGGWNEDVQIFQVDASEIVEQQINMLPATGAEGSGASLLTVQQPECVDFVDRRYEFSSVYSVAGKDGLPVKAAQWNAAGGKVTVSINDDSTSLTVKIVGANIDRFAPFSIAMSAGTSNQYSSLRIVGTGMSIAKKLHSFQTGVDPDLAPQEVAPIVDNPLIDSYPRLHRASIAALYNWGGPRLTLTSSSTNVNATGDTGSYAYPTVAEWDALFTGTVGAFDISQSGKTVGDYEQLIRDYKANDFANQLFGNVAGARIYDDYSWFRVRSATISPFGIQMSSQKDTIVSDLDPLISAAGMTVAQFDQLWAGSRVSDFEAQPLLLAGLEPHWAPGAVTRRNLALDPFMTAARSVSGFVRPMSNRFTGASGTYAFLQGMNDGPTPAIRSYAEYTVGATTGSGRGFHLVGNPEGTNRVDSAPAIPGQNVYLAVWVRHTGGIPMRLTLQWNNGSATVGSTQTSTSTAGETGWTRRIISAIAPTGATGFMSYVTAQGTSPTGTKIAVTGLDHEVTVTSTPFPFSGDTPADAGPGFYYEWEGLQFLSPSLQRALVFVP